MSGKGNVQGKMSDTLVVVVVVLAAVVVVMVLMVMVVRRVATYLVVRVLSATRSQRVEMTAHSVSFDDD